MSKSNIKKQGAIAVLVALMLIVLIGFLGLAVDGGYLFLQKNRLQNIADAAALSCVISNSDDACGEYPTLVDNSTNVNAVVNSINMFKFKVHTIYPVTCPNTTTHIHCAQAIVSKDWNTLFLGVLGNPNVSLSASAKAGKLINKACFVALNGITTHGSEPKILANECTIDAGDIINSGGGAINSVMDGELGQISVYNNNKPDCVGCSPAYTSSTGSLINPITPPTVTIACAGNPANPAPNCNANTCTYSPGTYCSKVTLTKHSIFENGTFILQEGIANNGFSMKNTCSGNNGVFFYVGTGGGWFVDGNPSTVVDLCAPTNCPPQSNGLLVYQASSSDFTLSGNSGGGGSFTYTGVLDFANTDYTFNGSPTSFYINGSLVVKSLIQNGNNVFSISAPTNLCNSAYFSSKARLVQ